MHSVFFRDFFDQHNRPVKKTIGKVVKKNQETGSVGDAKYLQRIRRGHSQKNIAAVRKRFGSARLQNAIYAEIQSH